MLFHMVLLFVAAANWKDYITHLRKSLNEYVRDRY